MKELTYEENEEKKERRKKEAYEQSKQISAKNIALKSYSKSKIRKNKYNFEKIIQKAKDFGYSFSEHKGTLFMRESNDIIFQEVNQIIFFKKVKEHIEELEENINLKNELD